MKFAVNFRAWWEYAFASGPVNPPAFPANQHGRTWFNRCSGRKQRTMKITENWVSQTLPLCHFWVALAVSCSALEIHRGMPWRFRLTVILIIRGSCLSCCDCGPSLSLVLYRSIWLCEWKITPFNKWIQFRLAHLDLAGYLAKSFLKRQQPSRSSVTEKSSIQIHLMSLNLSRIESALKPASHIR